MKAPEAGNTAETLRGTDRDSVANTQAAPVEQDDAAKEAEITAAASFILDADAELQAQIVAEREGNVLLNETVTREEFNALRDEFDALLERINKHNAGAPHKI